MTSNFKHFLQFYFIGLILSLITLLIFGAKVFNILINPIFYILPVVFNLVGFLLGLIVYELQLRRPEKKKKIFSISYSIGVLALLIVISIVIVDTLKRLKYKENFGNVESNHNVMKTWVNDDEEYIRIAFNRLESEFKNPNDFDLDAFSVRKKDTVVNGHIDTTYTIYFVYFLNTDTTNKYFSKVSVLAGKPGLKLYNVDTKKSEEYISVNAEKEKEEHEAVQELHKVFGQLKQLKDSLKNKGQ
jgi:amino acid transporter